MTQDVRMNFLARERRAALGCGRCMGS